MRLEDLLDFIRLRTPLKDKKGAEFPLSQLPIRKSKTGRKGARPEVKPKNRAGKSLVGAKLGPKLGPIGPVFES
jgi:hypothetical protein